MGGNHASSRGSIWLVTGPFISRGAAKRCGLCPSGQWGALTGNEGVANEERGTDRGADLPGRFSVRLPEDDRYLS